LNIGFVRPATDETNFLLLSKLASLRDMASQQVSGVRASNRGVGFFRDQQQDGGRMTASAVTAVNPFTNGHPIANATASGSQSGGTGASIAANDFLTLLVTEMKNQDPTAQTDPNQYINQLVQVNSLQQLLEINENLKASLGQASTGAAPQAHRAGALAGVPDSSAAAGQKVSGGTTHPIHVSANPIAAMTGNLGVSGPNPAAQRVAQALRGRR
jgi:flagellar basal-body rod modification protein FlgD